MAIDRRGATAKKPKNTNHKRNTREYIPPKKQAKKPAKKKKKEEPKKDYMPKTRSGVVSSHYGQVASKTQNTEENRKNASIKKAAGSVKKSLTVTDPNAKKVGTSWGNVTEKSQDRTFTDKKWTPKDVKEKVNPHRAKSKDVDYVGEQKGTAKGSDADAYNKSKNIQAALEKEGRKTVQVDSEKEIEKNAVEIRKANWKGEKDFAKQEYKWLVKNGYDVGGMTEEEFVEKYRKDTKAKRTKAAEEQAKKDSKYTYSKAPVSTNDALIQQTASLFQNTKVKTKTDKDKYVTDKSGNIKYDFSVDKDGNLSITPKKKKGKETIETTQGSNIIDYYAGAFNEKGQKTNENASQKIANQRAGFIHDAPFMTGVLQGAGYSDIKQGLGKMSRAAAKDVQKTTESGAFTAGYMTGFMGQFGMLGAGKIPDTMVRGIGKKGLERGALNIAMRKAGVSALAEFPVNATDALKMATDADGNVNKKQLGLWFGINTALSGGFTGIVGGVGSKMSKTQAKEYLSLASKNLSGLELTEEELARLTSLQEKFVKKNNGVNIANSDIVNKSVYDNEVAEFYKGEINADRAYRVIEGKASANERLNIGYSMKSMADAQFEGARIARENLLKELEHATPEEAVEIRKAASLYQKQIERLGEVANAAELQIERAKKANHQSLNSLNKTLQGMSKKTDVSYYVFNDKDMRKTIEALGIDVSDDDFYKGFYYKDKKGRVRILINSDSPQAHQTVLGHEVGHVIKSSSEQEFGELGTMLESYSKELGDYDAVVEQLKKAYPEATEKELQEEITCELLGRYVYGIDDKFIKKMAGEKPSLIQRIVNYFKELFDNSPDPELKGELKKIIDKAEDLIGKIDANKIDSTEQINADYMKAAKSGDEKTAQKYVDEFADKKFSDSVVRDDEGNLIKMYHGSVDNFTKFEKDKIRAADYDAPFNGFWFSSDKETSPAFREAKYTKAFYLDIKNPAPYSVYNKVTKQVREEFWGKDLPERSRSFGDEVRYQLQDMGYDGVHYDGAYKFTEANVKEFNETGKTTFEDAKGKLYDIKVDDRISDDPRLYPHNSWNEIMPVGTVEDFLEEQKLGNPYRNKDVWVAFEPTQIKSADAITKEDGKIIPLEKRFDETQADSKFSIEKKVTAEDGKIYHNVVKLDTDIFKGKDDAGRKAALRKHIEDDFMGNEIIATDDRGHKVTLHFANESDKSRKYGGRNRPTIKELSRKPSYRLAENGEPYQEVAAHIDEVIEVAKGWDLSFDKSHGWLDKYGWITRNFTAMEENGTLWDCKLYIAKADDGRKIVYDVDIEKEVGKRNATEMVATSHSTSKEIIPQSASKSNPEKTNMAEAFEKAQKGKFSKEQKSPQNGSFDAHRSELLSDLEESYGSKYTDNFNETGFIFPDGKLPKMGEYGQRADDHAIVGGLYDDISYATSQTPKADAMGRFLNEGNIRITPEAHSLELGSTVKPTTEQFSQIEKYIKENGIDNIEFTGKDGKQLAYKSYDSTGMQPSFNATQVVNDIKRFYKDGKIGGSEIDKYRFSKEKKSTAEDILLETLDDDFVKEVEKQANEWRNKKAKRAENFSFATNSKEDIKAFQDKLDDISYKAYFDDELVTVEEEKYLLDKYRDYYETEGKYQAEKGITKVTYEDGLDYDSWRELYDKAEKADKQLEKEAGIKEPSLDDLRFGRDYDSIKTNRNEVKAKRKISSVSVDEVKSLTDEEVGFLVEDLKELSEKREKKIIEAEIEKARKTAYKDSLNHYVVQTSDYDIDVPDKSARYTPERIDRIIRQEGHGDNKSSAYVALINPRDFVDLTLDKSQHSIWFDDSMRKWDYGEELKKNTQTPFLYVDVKTGEVYGHEGRHRLEALAQQDIESVPVLLVTKDENMHEFIVDTPKGKLELTGQNFDGKAANGMRVEVNDLVPVCNKYKEEITQKFGGEAKVKFSKEKRPLSSFSSGKEAKAEKPKETAKREKPKNEIKIETDFYESEEYKKFYSTKTRYASAGLKDRVAVAGEYGIDVAERIKEFNDLNARQKELLGKIKRSKNPEHIAEYHAEVEKAEGIKYQIARSIYEEVSVARGEFALSKGWTPKSLDNVAKKEISEATKAIGGVEQMASEIKKSTGRGSKKAEKLVTEEMKDYNTCLDNYLKGSSAKEMDMQNARASQLLDNIGKRLKENPEDADAMADLMKVVDKLSEDSTLPANVRSSAKTLADSTPKGRVGVALRAVDDLNKRYGERIDGVLRLDDDEVVRLINATGDELDELYKEITVRLWDNIPATRMEQFNEVRHMFMLSNIRTHARNTFGNMTFRGVRWFADETENLLQDKLFRKAIARRGGTVDRVHVTRSEIKENSDFLEAEFKETYHKSNSVSRWIETDRPDGVPTVKVKLLNAMIQGDYKALEIEDMWTFIPAYKKSYMQYVKSKGWDITALDEAQKQLARNRALFDAEYATFRDTSVFSSWLTGKKHMLATKEGKTILGTAMYRFGNMALEGLLPFVKTPVNIFRRSVDFSPISLIRCLGELSSKDPEVFKQGIKHLSTGLTGTGIFGLGFFLANTGHISIETNLGKHSGSKYYDQDMGYQEYSLEINVGGVHQSWSIDWVQPMEASLFMGAACRDMLDDIKNGDVNIGSDTIAALFGVTAPMFDASFMSSAKDMMETFERRASQETAEGEPNLKGAFVQALLGDIPKNYISSAIPQVFSQAANVSDDYQRDTRSTLKDPVLASWDSAAKQIANRIPVLRQKLLNPKLDRWGKDKKTPENLVWRFVNAAINPSNVKDITENKYDRELFKIRNSLEKGSKDYKNFFYNFTGNPNYDLDFGKGRMSYDKAYEYGKATRQEQAKIVKGMIDSPMYKKYMTDEMKADEVKSAYWTASYKGDQTIGDVYAAKRIAENEHGEDTAYKLYQQMNGGRPKKEVAKEFVDFYVKKEELYQRAHISATNDGYSVKALAGLMYNEKMLEVYDVEKRADDHMRKYWKDVLKNSKNKKEARQTAIDEVTMFTCGSTYYLKKDNVDSTAKGFQSVALGLMAKNGDKNPERVYRGMGWEWNEAQGGAGLMLKYNKDKKYSFANLEQMKFKLKHEFDVDDTKTLTKADVETFVNEQGITDPDEMACLFSVLAPSNWTNPWGTIKDHLEWGTEPDEYGSGGRRRRGGWGHRGGGGGGGSKGKMPNTKSGAFDAKITDPYKQTNAKTKSNLDDAYRKKARKLRQKQQ